MNITLKPSAKNFFFDRKTVQQAVWRAKKTTLPKNAAMVRLATQRVIRKRKKASMPGEPPHGHGMQRLRRGIYYAWDPAKESAIIGPVLLNNIYWNGSGRPEKGTVPNVLEFGGRMGVYEMLDTRWNKNTKQSEPAWRRVDLRSRRRAAGKPQRLRWVEIAARPYMSTGFEKVKDRLPKEWQNSVVKGAA